MFFVGVTNIEVGRTDSIKTRLKVFLYIFLYLANFYITTKDRFTRIRIIPRSSPVVELCFGGRETSSSTESYKDAEVSFKIIN